MKSIFSKVAGAVLALGAVVSVPAHSATIFDTFTFGQGAADATTDAGFGYSGQNLVADANIFGGHRELFAKKMGDVGSDPFADVGVAVFGGTANFSSDSGAFGFGVVRWDGANQTGAITDIANGQFNASTATSLGNLYNYGVGFSFTYNSDHAFDITILVYTKDGVWAAGQPVADTNDLDVTDSFLFSELVLISGSGSLADLTDTRAVEVIFNGLSVNLGRLDMSFTSPQGFVPEPATLALLGLGMVGAGVARRRAKK